MSAVAAQELQNARNGLPQAKEQVVVKLPAVQRLQDSNEVFCQCHQTTCLTRSLELLGSRAHVSASIRDCLATR